MWGDVKKAKETVQKYEIDDEFSPQKNEYSPQRNRDLLDTGENSYDKSN